MKYIFIGIIGLGLLLGLFIGSLIHLPLLGAIIGLFLACLLIDVRRRKKWRSPSQEVRQQMIANEINKADATLYMDHQTHPPHHTGWP